MNTKYFALLLSIIGCLMTFSSCDMLNSTATEDIHTPENEDPGKPEEPRDELNILRIRPKRIDINNSKGFVVFNNTSVLTRSGIDTADSTDVKEEIIPSSPYALYNIDNNGNIQLTVFYFEVEAGEDSTSVEVQKELSDALQLVPSIMTDLGDFLLFSFCRLQLINPTSLSEETLKFCNSIQNDEFLFSQIFNCSPEYRDRLVYLIRKTDGAMFDLTTQQIFTYAYSALNYQGCYEDTIYDQGYWIDRLNNVVLAPDKYRISEQGNIFCAGSNKIYKISNNGDKIDVSTMTQHLETFDTFDIDAEENIYIPVWTINGGGADYSVHIYKSRGGFNMSELDEGYYLDMQKDDKGNMFLFRTSNNFYGFQAISLQDGNCTSLYKSDMDNNESLDMTCFYFDSVCKDFNYFSTFLGCDNGEFKWLYGGYRANTYSGILLSYDTTTNCAKVLDVPANVETALSEKYDAIILGNHNIGVRINNDSIEFTDFDILAEKVNKRSYVVEAFKDMVGKKCIISEIGSKVYVCGKSTLDGTDIHVSVDLKTGENMATYGSDSRNVVSLVRIN